MSKTKYLEIHSRDRDTLSSISSTNFIYDLPYELKNVNKIKLIYASIPFSYYIINSNNNSVTTNLGTGTITPGNYTHAELVTALDTLFTGLGHGGVTISYSSTADAFTLFAAAGPTWTITFSSEMADILGFSSTSQTGSKTYISDVATQLNSINRELYIDLQQLSSNLFVASNMLPNFGIHNNVDKWENIVYRATSDYQQYSHIINDDIQRRLTIKLRNKNGNIIDLRSADWKFVLGIE